MKTKLLSSNFFDRDTVKVAQELIVCTLEYNGVGGVIVETEAYHDTEPGCHAYRGETPRNKVLFGEPGVIYAYFVYGMHVLVNIVTEKEGVGAAVLIRALEPKTGIDKMQARRGVTNPKNLCSGPGKLTQALGITLADNAVSLAKSPLSIYQGKPQGKIITGPRVGLREGKDLLWRFSLKDSPYVSKPTPVVSV